MRGKLGSNIKVNQNCLNLTDVTLQGRGQANNETAIAVNPNNASDLVTGNNDYRRGDGNCYGSYSLDNANQWNDTTIPMGFTNGANFGGVHASTGKQAVTHRSPGIRRATPTSTARCSCVALE